MAEHAKKEQPIIIIRKKGGHAGHHGGAWKVAYADFVTAMMAFFMVMWLMNSTKPVKDAIAGYFQDPTGSKGIMTGGSGIMSPGKAPETAKDDMEKLKLTLEKNFSKLPEFMRLKDQLKMTVTNEGLRVELLESDKGTFFQSGSAVPSADGREILQTMGENLGGLKNLIVVEGHTDARPFAGTTGYTNWELSSDRANAARKIMQQSGLGPSQVVQVRGFADQQLRSPDDPYAASNRRVTIIVKYQATKEKKDDSEKSAPEKSASENKSSSEKKSEPEKKGQPIKK